MIVKCAECECAPTECKGGESFENAQCANCSKDNACCCVAIHVTKEKDPCCNNRTCSKTDIPYLALNPRNGQIDNGDTSKTQTRFGFSTFLSYAKGLYAAALGIEILCIAAAETGENTGLYMFGFNTGGIIIAYVMGYALAGFTTFITILGRHSNTDPNRNSTGVGEIDSCCSVLEQDSTMGFGSNLKTTFSNFVLGFKHLLKIREQQGIKTIVRSSLFILVTAESACILTAETVDLIFYQYSLLLSVPLALLAGAFTVVVPAAYRKAKLPSINSRTAANT
jgi:hypothetical protein